MNPYPILLERYEYFENSDVVVLELLPELSYTNLPQLKKMLNNEISKGNVQVILNLQNVKMLYSTHMGTLVSSMKKLKKEGGDLKMCCLRPEVLAVFSSLDFIRIMDILPTEEEAIAAYGSLDG